MGMVAYLNKHDFHFKYVKRGTDINNHLYQNKQTG